jgi:hypothetical protein
VSVHRLEEKSFCIYRDRTPVLQPEVRHYTDCVTPAPVLITLQIKQGSVQLLTLFLYVLYNVQGIDCEKLLKKPGLETD